MREFTDKEQELIKLLIQKQGVGNNVKIGDVLLEFYNAQYMERIEDSDINIPLEKITVAFRCNNETKNDFSGFESKMTEAIMLILYLKENNQVVVKNLCNSETIGENDDKANYFDAKTGEGRCQPITIRNIYEGVKLWDLMNSVYVVNNSLVVLVGHKFKSVEQRNFDKQLSKTNWSIGIPAIALIVSTIMPFVIMKCSPDTDKQVEKIESAIKSTRTEYPAEVNVSLSDTLQMRNIEQQNIRVYNNIKIDSTNLK